MIIVLIVLIAASFMVWGRNNKGNKNQTNSNSTLTAADVTISNFAFSPTSLTVAAGKTLTFKNEDSVAHTVTDRNGKFDQTVAPGATITITIDVPGTYSYYCRFHPMMTGTIIVQ